MSTCGYSCQYVGRQWVPDAHCPEHSWAAKPAAPPNDPLTKEAEASVRLDGDTHCVDDAPQSDQPAPDDLPNRVRDDIAAWAEATHESGDQVTLEGFAEWLRHSWHWSGPALEKPTSQPSAAGADARKLTEKIFNLFQEEELCSCPSCRAEDGPTLAALLESFRRSVTQRDSVEFAISCLESSQEGIAENESKGWKANYDRLTYAIETLRRYIRD